MSTTLDTWQEHLDDEMARVGDSGPVVAYAPSPDAFQVKFDGDYGTSNGSPVLAWTETRVYFPVVYDGAEWMGSAPRNPQPEGQAHVGGE